MSAAPGPLWSESRNPAPVHDIGRQLHDIVVPQLFVLTTGLAALQRHPDRDDRLVDDLVETAAQALADLRAISRGQSLALGGPLSHVADRLIAATEPLAALSGCRVEVEIDDDMTIAELEKKERELQETIRRRQEAERRERAERERKEREDAELLAQKRQATEDANYARKLAEREIERARTR